MKATELQCYDIVNVDGKPVMIYGVMARMDRVYDTMTNDISAKRCYPIPLTAEILEKNGWKEAQFWHEYQDGKNTIQSCLLDMRGIINGVEIQHFKCEYVHQYQHLLRLCGLNDLADNIQIE